MTLTQSCNLCSHNCTVSENKMGRCKVRSPEKGKWVDTQWGHLSSLSIDPIEKKPLYHFNPGTDIFSVGFFGCNMRCPFCQNWEISQRTNINHQKMSPEELLQILLDKNQKAIAFTYSEPLIHYEYLMNWLDISEEHNIETLLITNGLMQKKWAKKLLPRISAANIDLKSFNKKVYKEKLGGDLKTVLDFIAMATEYCHVETTTLIVPEISDNLKETEELSQFLKQINPFGIHHISAYYPSYNYEKEATSLDLLKAHLDKAKQYLYWVYPGNSTLDSNSYCPDCNNLLIRRNGYSTEIRGLNHNNCTACGKQLPFTFSRDE